MLSPTFLLEPLLIIILLTGGTLINRRRKSHQDHLWRRSINSVRCHHRALSASDLENGTSGSQWDPMSKKHDRQQASLSFRASRSSPGNESYGWRMRKVGVLGWSTNVIVPDTRRYRRSFMSRILYRFPFLVEAWYWFLIYWVYQIGRAITAITIDQGVVHVARRHAFQIISLEKTIHIFHELKLQRAFLQHPSLIASINGIYSYVHIPATILFLICLYYVTITSPRASASLPPSNRRRRPTRTLAGCALYYSRRRTLATSNLIAFGIFTVWPLMPPRLLSDNSVTGLSGDKARAFGFVDTVHRTGKSGGSIWTTNKFCNQWAAMPSLHFGYALIIGMTIATLPLGTAGPEQRETPVRSGGRKLDLQTWRRLLYVFCGICYPMIILVAVISTANHFFLDVLGGAMVVGLAWSAERLLLNLLPPEDWFLSLLRIHKPEDD